MYFMNVTVYTIETTQMTLKHLADAFSPLSTNKFCPLLADSSVARKFHYQFMSQKCQNTQTTRILFFPIKGKVDCY